MKALTTSLGNFGPFHTIEVLADRYRCDNADLPFTVVGQGEIVEADTITWPEPPIIPPTVDEIVAAMEALFDTTAQSRRYDNRITCALRAGYAGPFQAEGLAFASWMDSCNAAAYQMLAQVQAGTMVMPATTATALALLPEMVWP
jgi:hypothetical protein